MHRRSFLAGSCFVLALAALTLIGTLSPSYQKCAADHQRDHAQNEQPNLHEGIASHAQIPVLLICEGAFIDANNGTLTALATIAIAAFTLTLWLATTNQGRLTRESIELGNREFGATHRPRVRIAYIRLNPLQAGVHATAEIWATNIGDGDAQIIEIGADIFVRRKNMAGTAAMGATPRPYPVPRVAPGQQANLQVRGGLPISSKQLMAYKAPSSEPSSPHARLNSAQLARSTISMRMALEGLPAFSASITPIAFASCAHPKMTNTQSGITKLRA
jgi:hypothetical protein